MSTPITSTYSLKLFITGLVAAAMFGTALLALTTRIAAERDVNVALLTTEANRAARIVINNLDQNGGQDTRALQTLLEVLVSDARVCQISLVRSDAEVISQAGAVCPEMPFPDWFAKLINAGDRTFDYPLELSLRLRITVADASYKQKIWNTMPRFVFMMLMLTGFVSFLVFNLVARRLSWPDEVKPASVPVEFYPLLREFESCREELHRTKLSQLKSKKSHEESLEETRELVRAAKINFDRDIMRMFEFASGLARKEGEDGSVALSLDPMIRRVQFTLDNMVDHQRLQDGVIVANSRSVRLSDVLEKLEVHFSFVTQSMDLSIEAKIDPHIRTDSIRLAQLLVSSMLDLMPSHSEAAITLMCAEVADKVTLSIDANLPAEVELERTSGYHALNVRLAGLLGVQYDDVAFPKLITVTIPTAEPAQG